MFVGDKIPDPCGWDIRRINFLLIRLQLFGRIDWKHRGNVELYFKHRYKDFNYRIESLTEYFKLADVEAVWHDLCQMPPKVLEPLELDVLSENFISSLCRH
jgi:hypothetical protein